MTDLTIEQRLGILEGAVEEAKGMRRLKRLIRRGELPRYQVKKVQVKNASGRTSTEFRLLSSIAVIMGAKNLDRRVVEASASGEIPCELSDALELPSGSASSADA